VARIGDRRDELKVLWGDGGGRENLDDLGVDGRIILKWILKTWDGAYGLDLFGSE
jgi:hypothetical protein